MCVLTIHHVKLVQSTVLEQKHFDLQSLSTALHNLWLLLVIIIIIIIIIDLPVVWYLLVCRPNVEKNLLCFLV